MDARDEDDARSYWHVMSAQYRASVSPFSRVANVYSSNSSSVSNLFIMSVRTSNSVLI